MDDFVTETNATSGIEEDSRGGQYVPTSPLESAAANAFKTSHEVLDAADKAMSEYGFVEPGSSFAPGWGTAVGPEPKAEPKAMQERFPGVKGLDHPMPMSVAEDIADEQHRDEIRQSAAARYPSGIGNAILDFGANTLAGFLDPVADAAFMVPVLGEAREAAIVAAAGRSAGLLGRAAAKFGVGAVRGAAGGALLSGGEYATGLDPDMTMGEAASETLQTALMGGVAHPLMSWRDVLSQKHAEATLGEHMAAKEAAARAAAAQMANWQPVEVRPLLGNGPQQPVERGPAGAALPQQPAPEAAQARARQKARAEKGDQLDTAVARANGLPTQEEIRARDQADEAAKTTPEEILDSQLEEDRREVEGARAQGTLDPEDDAILKAADAEVEALKPKGDKVTVAGKDFGIREPLYPEMMADGAVIAVYHLKAGARSFHAYAKAMIEDHGEWVRPYLKSFYESARRYPDFDTAGMTPTEEITPDIVKRAGLEQEPAAPMLDFADRVAELLAATGEGLNAKDLQDEAARIYGGTLASGTIPRDEFYDAIELGVNRYIANNPAAFSAGADVSPERAVQTAEVLRQLKARLPTQTVRAGEKESMQQFSTPPDYAYAAAWVGATRPADIVLEPSAGTGSILTHAIGAGPARVYANDLSARRAAMLRSLGPTAVFTENAEQISAIGPTAGVKPTLVLMNPPFSATQRMKGRKVLDVGAQHVTEALRSLRPGGRLVAIVGGGMTPDKAVYRGFFAMLARDYDLRANIGVGGKIYQKYGTTFPTRLLVIDKAEPSGREPVMAEVETAEAIIKSLTEVRNERPQTQGAQPLGGSVPEAGRPQPGTEGALSAGGEPGTLGPQPRAEAAEPTGTEPAQPAVGGGATGLPPGGRPAEGVGLADVEPERPRSAGAGEQPVEPTETGAGTLGGSAGGAGDGVRPDGSGERDEPGVTEAPETVRALEASLEPDLHDAPITDAIYEPYKPSKAKIEGAKEHPGALVQSAAMASVDPPTPNHELAIPKNLIASGALSDAQLETVLYAGHAHSETLPAAGEEPERRRGFFIGDGTGVGKGREVAGIMIDNWMHGRTRHVWVSEKQQLAADAKRDWKGLGRNENEIIEHRKTKLGEPIKGKSGVLFTTYDTLKSAETVVGKDGEKRKGKSRIQQIADWAGKDFDGVIAFDEAHNLGNAIDTKGGRGIKKAATKAIAGVELQKMLPNARVVYVSATGATEVQNLAYADRLGLWGRGTAFGNRQDFLSELSAGGVAAMELVARDMKAMGQYIARNLSYDGVEYDRLEHTLTEQQRDVYDKLAEAWQVVLSNMHAAMESAGITEAAEGGGVKTLNSRAKSAILSQFWGGHQRFFNQVITSMQMPSVLGAVERDIAEGRHAVLQLVNTNEAAQERALQKAKAEGEGEIEDLDMTPRDQLLQMVARAFPTQRFEEYLDENGNRRSQPVTDSKGNPVHDPELIARREALLDQLGTLRVPDGPLEILLNHFGPDRVAEVTGRKQRVVRKADETGQMRNVVEKRPGQSNVAEPSAFQDGKKKILVFSEAGGTGRSYHADIGAESAGARRSHYLVQAGWRADKAVQGFGRTHRTNQASAPVFHLVTTDLQGQKRFISSIARRLGQLGALTKGERRTGNQGMFGLRDNLESEEAKSSLRQLYTDIADGKVPMLPLGDFERQLGLRLTDNNGIMLEDLPPMTQFLNRLLSLKFDTQNAVFDELSKRIDDTIERAAASGTLDSGVETYRADSIKKKSEQVVYTEPRSGAQTRHVHLEVGDKVRPRSWEDIASGRHTGGKPPLFFTRSARSGRVFAVSETSSFTDKHGDIIDQYKLVDPVTYQYLPQENLANRQYWTPVEAGTEKAAWQGQIEKLPSLLRSELHLITGAVLPIWDRLGGNPRVFRLQTDEGERMLGRVIPNDSVNATLSALGAQGMKVTATPQELAQQVQQGASLKLVNGWAVKRVNVAGEQRIELVGPDYAHLEQLKADGVFTERIQWQTRFFVPSGDTSAEVLSRILKEHPAAEVVAAKSRFEERRRQIAPKGWERVEAGEGRGAREDLTSDVQRQLNRFGAQTPEEKMQGIAAYVLDRGTATHTESFAMHDPVSGRVIASTDNYHAAVGLDGDVSKLLSDPNNRFVSVHNHPSGTAPSQGDLGMLSYPGHAGMIVVGHNGHWYGVRMRDGVEVGAFLMSRAYNLAFKDADLAIAAAFKRGEIGTDEADMLVAHVANVAMDRAGLTHYMTSYALPDHLTDIFDRAALFATEGARYELDRLAPGEVGFTPPDSNRSPEPVPFAEGMAQLLDHARQVAGTAAGSPRGPRGTPAGAGIPPPDIGDGVGGFREDTPYKDREEREALAAKKRQAIAYADARKRKQLYAKLPMLQARGASLVESFDALVRGINKDIEGGKDSTSRRQTARVDEFSSFLVSQLDRIPGATKLWASTAWRLDPDFTRNWVRELYELNRKDRGQPGITKNKTALDVAKAVKSAQDLARAFLNRTGAWIGDYDGYISRTMHDAVKIHRAGYQAWRDFVLERLDQGRTFAGIMEDDDLEGMEPKDRIELFMQRMWDALSTGVHMSSDHGVGMHEGAFGTPANLGRRHSSERVLHWKDADAWIGYQEKFGSPNIEWAVENTLRRAARDGELMDRWTSNPRYAFERLMRRAKEKNRGDHDAVNELTKHEGRIREEFAWLTGEAMRPRDALSARIMGSVRAARHVENITKLPFVLAAHFSVGASKPYQLHYAGIGRWKAYTSVLKNLFQDKSPEGRAILENLNASAQGRIQHLNTGYEANDGIPGQLSKLEMLTMRMGLLPQAMAREKVGTQWELANFLGQNVGKGFDDLKPQTRRVLSQSAIGPAEWDALRQAPNHDRDADGLVYLTPKAADRAEDDVIARLAGDRYRMAPAKTRPRILAETRDTLAMKLAGFYAETADRSVVTPGIPEKALFTRYAGRALGPLLGQYKVWALAAVRQMWGQVIHGSSKREAVIALMELAAVGTAMGYLRQAFRDVANGKEPEWFTGDGGHDASLVLRCFLGGGTAGIYGDYLLGQFGTYGAVGEARGLRAIEKVAGPVVSDVAALYGLASDFVAAPFSEDKAKAFRSATAEGARFLSEHAPVVNAFYFRLLANWLFLDRMQEAAQPGYLKRYEQRTKERTGQSFWLQPSAYLGSANQ